MVVSDSPPVCLTQDLSPEKTAEILLLGCGDPKSILYTVFADLAPKNRPIDITCCDWEPAVLARNILLLTMIVDGVAVESAWSIFYHFFLDKASYDTLSSQCHTLIYSSSTMKTWKESKYGRFLRFCTEHSLAEIRRCWVLYLESQNDTEEERKALKKLFSSGMKSVHDRYGDEVDSSRAAGPVAFAMLTEGHASRSHENFWTTEATPYKFNVHHVTDPIMAFYLAPAFTPGKDGRHRPSKSLNTVDFVECAKSQFSAWCSSEHRLRVFVGECLALCQALHVCKEQKTAETGIYAHPWGGSLIALDDDYRDSSATPAPLLFNVIDTSDLADRVGIVNFLVATVPLLLKTPCNNVCGDIPTFSMLLGVAPSPYLWHFTPRSNKHGIIGPNRIPCELHESISWRFISSFIPNVPPAPENTDMGYFNFVYFFGIYLRMFAYENPTSADKGHASNLKQQGLTAAHYTRASFVAVLALVKGSVRVNWSHDGMNSYQDLSCHLHLRNVHTFPDLTLDVEPLRTSQDRFQGWRYLKRIEDMAANDIVTPMLQCELHGINFHNVYSSIHLTFGDTQSSIVDGESQVTVKEDPHGWSGTSPLIATFYVPSWTLTSAPTATLVGLHLRRSRSTQSLSMASRFGENVSTIFSTSLMDKSYVQVVCYRPHNAQELKHLCNTNGHRTPIASINIEDVTMKFDPTGEKATSLIMRKNFTEPNASRALAGGSKVSTQPLSDSSVVVAFGDYTHRFYFPFASSYIEIESLIRPDFADSRDISRNPFPVAYDRNQINLVNIHYLNLDTLPGLFIPKNAHKRHWVSFLFMVMFSAAERREQETYTNLEDVAPLINLKKSISVMSTLYIKPHLHDQRKQLNVFCLLDPRDSCMDTLFFVNGIKFDLGSHTALKANLKMHPALANLQNKPRLNPGINKSLMKSAWASRFSGGLMHSPLCSCGKGKNLGWFGTVAEWAPAALHVRVHGGHSRAVANEKSSQATLVKKLCAGCGNFGTLQTCAACLRCGTARPNVKGPLEDHKPACLAARPAK
ncbi:hypothetical protein BJ912DRAFT_938757 [Pholiota molesta]|nr:hypothetical protein BJ912DRAFT_938757 [Pholiota molesta]